MANDAADIERKIVAALEPIGLTLHLLFAQDQRVGAKALYKETAFNQAIRDYYLPILDRSRHSAIDRAGIRKGVDAFMNYVNARFPFGRRMVTELRHHFGKAFSQLYKNSVSLSKLLDEVSASDDSSALSIALPDQRSSPIMPKSSSTE